MCYPGPIESVIWFWLFPLWDIFIVISSRNGVLTPAFIYIILPIRRMLRNLLVLTDYAMAFGQPERKNLFPKAIRISYLCNTTIK